MLSTQSCPPAAVRSKLPAKAVFESGILSASDAAYARSLGFTGILVGEAVAKNPPLAKDVVSAFETGSENARGKFWKKIAERRNAKREACTTASPNKACHPLVKICGITREEDGMLAVEMGVDLLGFVFSTTRRLTTEEFVRSFAEKMRLCHPEQAQRVEGSPLLVGVITDPDSPEGKTAIKLAHEEILDAVQFHGIPTPANTGNALPCYAFCLCI